MQPSLVVCRKCNAILKGNDSPHSEAVRVPDDWSFVQLKTSGEYGGKKFTVTGRVRLQLRNDYKNFWCCAFTTGEHMWLMESFASFTALAAGWTDFGGDVSALKAGSFHAINNTEYKGEYVEKCEALSFEGEIGEWNFFTPGFFMVQASNRNGDTMIFMIKPREATEFLSGKKVDINVLNLDNIIVWNEWK